MVQTYRSSILPLIAFILTIGALCYSACHESRADQNAQTEAVGLTEEISRFENALSELKTIHTNHIKQYSDGMGCLRDSKALELIDRHNALLDHHSQRLQYHKMNLLQSDTGNLKLKNKQFADIKHDFLILQNDAQQIRTGFDNFKPAHITK